MTTKKQADPFATDADTNDSDDRTRLSDHLDELVVLQRTEDAITIATTYGEKEAVPARVLLVDGPPRWLEVLVFNGVLVRDLKATDKPLAGRLEQRPTKKGNPALVLERAKPGTDDHKAALDAYAAANESIPF